MRFWDSSALFAMAAGQHASAGLDELSATDSQVVVWWGTIVEMVSAACRLRREGELDDRGLSEVMPVVERLCQEADEIGPSERVRHAAVRLLRVHGLKAGDSLQLAAALVWAGDDRSGSEFVSLDIRLRAVAALEGFRVLPE
jgi:uncharacterized protein